MPGGIPIIVVDSGGIPVTQDNDRGFLVTEVTSVVGGLAVTVVDSGAGGIAVAAETTLGVALVFSANTINEGSPAGTLAASISASDGGAVTNVTIVDVDGDTMSTLFAVNGTDIEAGATATDYETLTEHTISITADIDGEPFAISGIVIVNDVTTATLSSPTAAATSDTTASIGVDTDINNGTLYAVSTLSATPPTAQQVIDGKNDGGTAAAWTGSQVINSTGTKSFTPSGLTAGTDYYAYFVHENVAGERSSVAAADPFTTTVSVLSLVGSVEVATGTNALNVPAGIAFGDVIVVVENATNGGAAPTNAAPTGFTTVASAYMDMTTRAFQAHYKVADGTETTVPLPSGRTEWSAKLYVFRPVEAVDSVSTTGEAT
jgi:hypothetical protein